MTEKSQITISDCEELCDGLLRDANPQVERYILWEELWRRLMHKLGHSINPDYDLMLPPIDPNQADPEENRIAAIRGELYKLLGEHTNKPRAFMKIFDRINEGRRQ